MQIVSIPLDLTLVNAKKVILLQNQENVQTSMSVKQMQIFAVNTHIVLIQLVTMFVNVKKDLEMDICVTRSMNVRLQPHNVMKMRFVLMKSTAMHAFVMKVSPETDSHVTKLTSAVLIPAIQMQFV